MRSSRNAISRPAVPLLPSPKISTRPARGDRGGDPLDGGGVQAGRGGLDGPGVGRGDHVEHLVERVVRG